MEPLIILAVSASHPLLWLLITYNRLVRCRSHCVEPSSDIEMELKRLQDLIPNLVAMVRATAAPRHDISPDTSRA